MSIEEQIFQNNSNELNFSAQSAIEKINLRLLTTTLLNLQLQELVKNNSFLKYFNDQILQSQSQNAEVQKLSGSGPSAANAGFRLKQCRVYESILLLNFENSKLKISAKVFIDRLGRYPQIPSVVKFTAVQNADSSNV